MNDTDRIHKIQKKNKSFKKYIITSVIIVVISIVCSWYYISISENTTKKSENDPALYDKDLSKSAIEVVKKGEAQVDSGNYDNAVTIYKDAAEKTNDDIEKFSFLMEQAYVLFSEKQDYAGAAQVAQSAEKINSSRELAAFIAESFELNGEKEKAIEYYTKAISLVDKTEPIFQDYIDSYQSKINELTEK